MNLKIGKLKVVFFMSSGQNVIIKCEKFEMTKLSGSIGTRELTIEGADRKWSIDVDEVVAITSKRVWF